MQRRVRDPHEFAILDTHFVGPRRRSRRACRRLVDLGETVRHHVGVEQGAALRESIWMTRAHLDRNHAQLLENGGLINVAGRGPASRRALETVHRRKHHDSPDFRIGDDDEERLEVDL